MDGNEAPSAGDGGRAAHSPEDVSTALDLLSNGRRRLLLHCLRDRSDERISFDALIAAWADRCSAKEDTLALEAHHVHLPKLEANGVIDYDDRRRTIRYHDDHLLDRCLSHLKDVHR